MIRVWSGSYIYLTHPHRDNWSVLDFPWLNSHKLAPGIHREQGPPGHVENCQVYKYLHCSKFGLILPCTASTASPRHCAHPVLFMFSTLQGKVWSKKKFKKVPPYEMSSKTFPFQSFTLGNWPYRDNSIWAHAMLWNRDEAMGRLPPASCLLPPAPCLLTPASFLLPPGSWLLPPDPRHQDEARRRRLPPAGPPAPPPIGIRLSRSCERWDLQTQQYQKFKFKFNSKHNTIAKKVQH